MASGVLSQPKGYARHTVGAAAVDLRDTPAAGVTLPDGAVSALIQVFTQSVIMRDDGSAATATDGVKIDANEVIIYRGDLEKLSFIRAGGSDGEIRVLFYGAEPPEITADTSAGGGGVETLLTAIKTAVELIDNAISGSEMQVDVVAALPAGTNAIGKLAANSGVDIGDVDVTSQPARDRATDNVGVALQTDAIMNDTTVLTPKFAVIDAASSGDNTLVAAVSGKKIRVLALFLVAAGTVNVRFESGASGTALTGQMNLVANSGFTLPFNPVGWFETAATTLLNLELSGAISTDGAVVYVEV